MRKFSLVMVAAMLLFTSGVFANKVDGNKPVKSLSAQISEMLSANNFNEKAIDTSAQVRFTLNAEGEIVVMSVDTENDQFESFVKARLNYKKVDLAEVKEGKLYKVVIRVAG